MHLTNFDNWIGLKNIFNKFLKEIDNDTYGNKIVFYGSIKYLTDIED